MRFHEAVRDGLIQVLKETTRRDCNTKDEDGLTPTLWASYEGNLEALRLLIGRGGNPEKCDNFGNTALHLAAAKGHFDCIIFLVNFGVNIWSLDIDLHTGKDLAGINEHENILRYLDELSETQFIKNPKHVKKLKENALKKSKIIIKKYRDLQSKMDLQAFNNELEMFKGIRRQQFNSIHGLEQNNVKQISYFKPSKFSDTINIKKNVRPNAAAKIHGSVRSILKRVQVKSSVKTEEQFKVRELSKPSSVDGNKMSKIRYISGLKTHSDIMFLPSETLASSSSSIIKDVNSESSTLTHSKGLFERPGFGSVVFRKSLNENLYSIANSVSNSSSNDETSIGSTSSIQKVNGETDYYENASLEDCCNMLDKLLIGMNLREYSDLFHQEKVDINILMDLNENDLKEMGLPLGPRKTILKMIQKTKCIS